MERLDEIIAALERARRQEQKQAGREEPESGPRMLSLEEMGEGIREGHLFLPGKGELVFKTLVCFPERIPLVFPEGFYTVRQETEDAVILANGEENVGQTLVRLPSDMEKLDVEAWAARIREGMKAGGLYADILQKKSLEFLDYVSCRVPSKEGWVYNIFYRVHRTGWRVTGGGSCMDRDRDTYGRLLEAAVLETARGISGEA